MTRIIIADDSATARMLIRRCLEIIGLGDALIIETEDGKAALAAAKENLPDLLLTDLNMPVMDGETLLKWVKASPKLCDLPVVVITSVGNPEKEAQLLKLGARQVIHKPLTPPRLLQALADFLADQVPPGCAGENLTTPRSLDQAMQQAASQVLAKTAFVEIMEHYDPNYAIPAAELIWARLQISAPVQGEIRLAMTKSLLKKLTAWLYVSDPEKISRDQKNDVLHELLNTISGAFMSNLLAERQSFQLGLPEAGQGELPEAGKNLVAWTLMTADEEPLQLFAVGDALISLNQSTDQ